jgi:branched-chain amino acid aminotransferase
MFPMGHQADHQELQRLTWIDGEWRSGNPPMLRAFDQATWLGAAIFDGSRAFDGLAPDLTLHCRRAVQSAANLGLKSPIEPEAIESLAREGIRRFPAGSHLYIRPFMWASEGGLIPDPQSTRFSLSISISPLPEPGPWRACLSRLRRPGPDMAPTNAKAVALYAQAGRAQADAQQRGFDDAVMLGPDGKVAEFTGSNFFMARDCEVLTPAPNGTFLNGITRQRVIRLLRDDGKRVTERGISPEEIANADEIFSTGNFAKVLPVTGYEDRDLQPGPIYRRARELYFNFAKTQPV